jgi:hypothetical protein
MSTPDPIVGYMDMVDWEHELGEAKGGNRVYPSVKDLKECRPCVAECGIVKVEVRFLKVVKKQDFSDSFKKAKPLDKWTEEDKKKSKLAARKRLQKHAAIELLKFTELELNEILQMVKEIK